MDVVVYKGIATELFPDGAPEFHPDILVIRNYEGEVKVDWEWNGTEFFDPITPQMKADALRSKRNKRLAETDWWEFRGTITEEQLAYRQALRDLTEQSTFPDYVVFPHDPTTPAPDSYENAVIPPETL